MDISAATVTAVTEVAILVICLLSLILRLM